jgi:hypothetical protein
MSLEDFYNEYPDIPRLIHNIPGAKVNLPEGLLTGAKLSPAPKPEAPPQPSPTPSAAEGSKGTGEVPEDVEDTKVESELSKYFNVDVEDIIPKEVLDMLTKQAKGGMELHDAIGIAGIAITNPQLAGELLLDIDRRKSAAQNTLVNLSQQVGSFRKEGARQLAMYMRTRKDQRFAQSKLDRQSSDKEYLERSKQVGAFAEAIRKSGLDPDALGVPAISEEVLRDPVKFGNWVQAATSAVGKGQGKQNFLAEISGMKPNGPATLAAKTGADPTAAVEMLAQQHDFTPDELAQLHPMIQSFATVAQKATAGIDQRRLRDEAAMRYMESQANKNAAEIAKINNEVRDNPGMKRDKAMALLNSTMMLQMTAQTEFSNVQAQLAAELRKVTPEAAASAESDFLPFNQTDDPNKVQDPAKIEALQRRMESASMMIGESNQAIASLYPIAQGMTGAAAGDINSMLQDIGPKLAEASRVATLGGKLRPPGVPPPVIAEAMTAAATPASWLAYLKQPPMGLDGQPNPYRVAYWASVVRQMGASLGGLQDPEDIIRLLDAQSMGQPSYADVFAGQDISLPTAPISAMAGSLTSGGGAPPPQSPAGGSQEKPTP